jgi:hypothetical protein
VVPTEKINLKNGKNFRGLSDSLESFPARTIYF